MPLRNAGRASASEVEARVVVTSPTGDPRSGSALAHICRSTIMEIWGVHILGLSGAGLRKLALTAIVLSIVFAARRLVKTTVMEMGVPRALFPDRQHWVGGRQYTGRVVSIANAEIFRQPVFNYTANFELLSEELTIPLRYGTNLERAEELVLEIARTYTREAVEIASRQLEQLRRTYLLQQTDLEPSSYVRLTDNWIELTVRFLVSLHDVRSVKDRISRAILAGFEAAKIDIASQTIEVVRTPTLTLRREHAAPAGR